MLDKRALNGLNYGVFMLASGVEDQSNGCIVHSAMQVANSPTRIAVSVPNDKLTCEMIRDSSRFTLSVLDQTLTEQDIRHWDLQSGYNVDKMEGLHLPTDKYDVPYLDHATCAMLSCVVEEQLDLKSNSLFVAKVTDGFVLSEAPPLAYLDYQVKLDNLN